MKFNVGPNCLLISILVAPPASAAAVLFSEHLRHVEAGGNVAGSEVDSRSTSAPGIWFGTAFADPFVGGGGTALARAWQSSEVNPAAIIMGGNLSAAATSSFPEFPIASASATSQLIAKFSVTPNTRYISQMATFGNTEVDFYFRPSGSSGNFLANSRGILSPGNYELGLNFGLAAESGDALEGRYLYNLIFVPEPSTLVMLILAAAGVCSPRRRPLLQPGPLVRLDDRPVPVGRSAGLRRRRHESLPLRGQQPGRLLRPHGPVLAGRFL